MIRSGAPGATHARLIELVDGEWREGASLPPAPPISAPV